MYESIVYESEKELEI